ncbi:hypothetical protein OE88DRAFT_1039671 [Heliocybe sulcata]|uniref:Ubiquitin-like domain-containing protein n=1 Tax=Heliocybe sulcata TaxID=5364 RepID=A0A5C3MN35_9AGAM|nr:hypothetical protein OE88DRAFT_1039671 [Heliocybe sulcata]
MINLPEPHITTSQRSYGRKPYDTRKSGYRISYETSPAASAPQRSDRHSCSSVPGGCARSRRQQSRIRRGFYTGRVHRTSPCNAFRMSLTVSYIRVKQRWLQRRHLFLLLRASAARRWAGQKNILNNVYHFATLLLAGLTAVDVALCIGRTISVCSTCVVASIWLADLVAINSLAKTISHDFPLRSASVETAKHSAPSAQSNINIFVRGVSPVHIHLFVSPSHTIGDIKRILRRRHLVPELSRLGHSIHYPPLRARTLGDDDTLESVGIGNLSTLEFRTHLVGGARIH